MAYYPLFIAPVNYFTPVNYVTVGTYNILFPQPPVPDQYSSEIGYDECGGKIYENSERRLGIVQENLWYANLDIVCLQEVVPSTLTKLQNSRLSERYSFTNLAIHNGDPNGHGVTILYRKEKFLKICEFVEKFTIPTINSNCPEMLILKGRAQMVLELEDYATQKVLRVVTSHFNDPRSLWEKDVQVKKAVEATTRMEAHVSIIAGDFNQDQYGDIGGVSGPAHEIQADEFFPPKNVNNLQQTPTAFKPLIEKGFHVSGSYLPTEIFMEKIGCRYVKFTNRRIDWIWVKGGQISDLALKSFNPQGSDHLLVSSIVTY